MAGPFLLGPLSRPVQAEPADGQSVVVKTTHGQVRGARTASSSTCGPRGPAGGLLDIAAALEWVRDNIETFGGDPGTVMIWGESGGGAKTATLTAMPRAQGLFHRASIESGPPLRLTPRDAATETTRRVLAGLGLSEKQARELVKVPAERLRALQQEMSGTNPMMIGPVVDGHHIPSDPYDPVAPALSANVPLIVGTNKDESIMFLQRGDLAAFSLDEASLRERLKARFADKAERILEVQRRGRPGASLGPATRATPGFRPGPLTTRGAARR